MSPPRWPCISAPVFRSTFGTGTELLNSLQLMYSRLASHCCPNGHYLTPSLAVAAGKELVCPECHGSRLSAAARAPKLRGISLDEACTMTLSSLVTWIKGVPDSLPEEMRPMAESICEAFLGTARRLLDLGLGYLTLGEETPSLSGGEAQRLKLASEIGKTRTDSVFVFDEPSIGLHPLDVQVLLGVFQALLDNGATMIVIEHDLDVIRNADWAPAVERTAAGSLPLGPRRKSKGTKTASPADICKISEGQSGNQIRSALFRNMRYPFARRLKTLSPAAPAPVKNVEPLLIWYSISEKSGTLGILYGQALVSAVNRPVKSGQ